MMRTLDDGEIGKVIQALLREAKKGDVSACRELLDRIFGKARQEITVDGQMEIIREIAGLRIKDVVGDER